eukprot:25890-Eustigmatos_ZCMA.PRE.1
MECTHHASLDLLSSVIWPAAVVDRSVSLADSCRPRHSMVASRSSGSGVSRLTAFSSVALGNAGVGDRRFE